LVKANTKPIIIYRTDSTEPKEARKNEAHINYIEKVNNLA